MFYSRYAKKHDLPLLQHVSYPHTQAISSILNTFKISGKITTGDIIMWDLGLCFVIKMSAMMVNPLSAIRDYGRFYSILSADQITVIGNEDLQMLMGQFQNI